MLYKDDAIGFFLNMKSFIAYNKEGSKQKKCNNKKRDKVHDCSSTVSLDEGGEVPQS
mgnify:CR=1 FL=1